MSLHFIFSKPPFANSVLLTKLRHGQNNKQKQLIFHCFICISENPCKYSGKDAKKSDIVVNIHRDFCRCKTGMLWAWFPILKVL